MVLSSYVFYYKTNSERGVKEMEQAEIKRIGQILKDRRLQFGYTQEFAAEKTGISYSYYTKIERGEQLPSMEVCIQLAKTFRLSLDSWIGNTTGIAGQQRNISPELLDAFHYLDEIDPESLQKVSVLLQKLSIL